MTKLTVAFVSALAVLLSAYSSCAQQMPLHNGYIINKYSLSPAYAGIYDNFDAFASYRRDFSGLPGAPETRSVTASGNICNNMGIGAKLTTFQAGIFTNLSATLSYAYHIKISGTSIVSIAIGAGILENHLDLSGESALNDPMLNSVDRTSGKVDANFGIIFKGKNCFAGITAPRISPNTNSEQTVYILENLYSAHAGYNYKIGKNWELSPVALIYLGEHFPMYYEIQLPVVFQQKFWIVPGYKKTSISLGFGGKIYRNMMLFYTYEYSSKGMQIHTGNNHEVTLGWKINKTKSGDVPAPDNKKPYYEWMNQ